MTTLRLTTKDGGSITIKPSVFKPLVVMNVVDNQDEQYATVVLKPSEVKQIARFLEEQSVDG